MDQNEFIEKIKSVIKKIPHSECRVPYTYHHDFLRYYVYPDYSRGDVAGLKNWTEEELWATSLVGLIWGQSFFEIVRQLTFEDIKICEDAKKVVDSYVEKLKSEISASSQNN